MWRLCVLLCLVPARGLLSTGGSSTSYSTTKLEQLHVNKSAISVSGISSGGAMAVQFHVAFSASVMGMGSVAGVPYHCSQGNLGTALGACMSSPSGISVPALVQAAQAAQSSGKIDSLDNLRNSRVFIWTGSADSVVKPQVSDKIEEFYYDFQAAMSKVVRSGAEHTFPTMNYGTSCSTSASPYIGKCSYSGAFHLLNHIYGDLREPQGQVTLAGKFIQFDQAEFIGTSRRRRFLSLSGSVNEYVNSVLQATLGGSSTGSTGTTSSSCSWLNWIACLPGMGGGSLPTLPDWGGSLPGIGGSLPGSGGSLPGSSTSGGHHSMDIVAYAYIPSGCVDKSKACKLHVAFHGCKQGRESIGDVFARHAGYNEVAELNDIIVVYPQAVANMVGGNPNGCWDWWGYDNKDFDNKQGPQMKAVKRMIDRLTG